LAAGAASIRWLNGSHKYRALQKPRRHVGWPALSDQVVCSAHTGGHGRIGADWSHDD
jgi:hypothetical protein